VNFCTPIKYRHRETLVVMVWKLFRFMNPAERYYWKDNPSGVSHSTTAK